MIFAYIYLYLYIYFFPFLIKVLLTASHWLSGLYSTLAYFLIMIHTVLLKMTNNIHEKTQVSPDHQTLLPYYMPTSLRSLISSNLILRKIHTSRNSPTCFNVVDLLVSKIWIPNPQTCNKDHVCLFWKGTNLLASPKTILSCPKWHAANQFQFPKPGIGGVIVLIPQSETKVMWSFQSKAWYDKLIFLAEWWYVFFLEHQQKPVRFQRMQQNYQNLSPALSFLAP